MIEKKLITIILILMAIFFLSGNVFAESLTITPSQIVNGETYNTANLNIKFEITAPEDLNYFWTKVNNDSNQYFTKSDFDVPDKMS